MASMKAEKPVGTSLSGQAKKEPATGKATTSTTKAPASKPAPKKAAPKTPAPKKKVLEVTSIDLTFWVAL